MNPPEHQPAPIHSAPEGRDAAAVLAEAFAHDPLLGWVFPGASRPRALLEWWSFHLLNALANPEAELWSVADGAAAALWYRPREPFAPRGAGFHDTADDHAARARYEAFVARLLGERAGEVRDAFALIESVHPEEPHWYLAAVGTRPAQQSRGLGAAVLRPALERCDETGRGAYLESSNPLNLPFYERLGFAAREPVLIAGEVTVMPMWREPR